MNKFLVIMSVTALLCFGRDNVPYSFKHPGSLPVDSVPIFICFGFDDNCFTDGITWADNLFMAVKNPDGSPARATFYISSHPENEDQKLWGAIRALYGHGHEIGNHTQHHDKELFASKLTSPELWNAEIGGCTADLNRQSGIPKSAIMGFRTPFLIFSSATFTSMQSQGIMYDCSVEHGLGQFQQNNTFLCGEVWPYTLDNGTAAPGCLVS
ncbi:MAG: polysaccharide deacetylase family protein, partial [Chitinivibrionales bacterium]|nr:polysaccharide deacetylase family protein [Chitinivibrionales bacterium]